MTRKKVMLEIDREAGNAVLNLADYVKSRAAKGRVIEKTYSLLLVALMLEGDHEAFDGFERIMNDMDLLNEGERSRLYGEFLMMSDYFLRRYRRYKYMLVELERVLPSDLREFPEEMFKVEWSNHGDVLVVS